MSLVKEIDALLPQTQCAECGYPGCFPYAQAMADGSAPINKCPPGGVDLVRALGNLLQIDPAPYLLEAEQNTRAPSVAVIREPECIGCTKCITACPVDAIIGSGKLMHSIIAVECTGCGLCVEPCPVDCIEMHSLQEPVYDSKLARQRFNAKQTRLLEADQEKKQKYQEKSRLKEHAAANSLNSKAKQEYIQQALARVQAKKKR